MLNKETFSHLNKHLKLHFFYLSFLEQNCQSYITQCLEQKWTKNSKFSRVCCLSSDQIIIHNNTSWIHWSLSETNNYLQILTFFQKTNCCCEIPISIFSISANPYLFCHWLNCPLSRRILGVEIYLEATKCTHTLSKCKSECQTPILAKKMEVDRWSTKKNFNQLWRWRFSGFCSRRRRF